MTFKIVHYLCIFKKNSKFDQSICQNVICFVGRFLKFNPIKPWVFDPCSPMGDKGWGWEISLKILE